jgi:hypothetical protein
LATPATHAKLTAENKEPLLRAIPLPLLLTACMGSATAGARTQGHPHFDDGGTLQWYTTFAEAKAAAEKADKLIFIEFGRKT